VRDPIIKGIASALGARHVRQDDREFRKRHGGTVAEVNERERRGTESLRTVLTKLRKA
jgi:hypothetical protein